MIAVREVGSIEDLRSFDEHRNGLTGTIRGVVQSELMAAQRARTMALRQGARSPYAITV